MLKRYGKVGAAVVAAAGVFLSGAYSDASWLPTALAALGAVGVYFAPYRPKQS
jgi:hypothetical protein